MTETFQRNLKALMSRQPEFATLLAEHTAASGAELIRGRDGHWTWRVRHGDGRRGWLGQTSMPSVSVPIWIGAYEPAGGNIWLAGPTTGLEMGLLAARMLPHTAVFVLVDDAALVGLQMHLYDFSSLISDGRVVFLRIDALDSGLVSFIRRNPGYELPRQLLFTPPVSAESRKEIQLKVEQASEQAASAHAEWMASLRRRISSPRLEPAAKSATIALISVDARPHALEHAKKTERAFGQLELSHTVCVPFRPDSCHAVARIRAIVESGAEIVLWLNRGSDSLTQHHSGSTTVASWHVGEAPDPVNPEAARSSAVITFVDRQSSAQALRNDDGRRRPVYVCEPAADVVQFRRVRLSPDDRRTWGADVTLLADRIDDEPGSAGITLPSHTELWNEMRKTARREMAIGQDSSADRLLAASEKRTGVSLTEQRLRSTWMTLIRERIIPAARLESAVQSVLTECAALGASVALYGRNWHSQADGRRFHRGPIPSSDSRNLIYNATRILLLLNEEPMNAYHALDALSMGTPVVLHGDLAQFKKEYPRLADVLPFFRFHTPGGKLQDYIRECISGLIAAATCARAVELIQRRHTVTHRVRWIIETVRERSRDTVAGAR